MEVKTNVKMFVYFSCMREEQYVCHIADKDESKVNDK